MTLRERGATEVDLVLTLVRHIEGCLLKEFQKELLQAPSNSLLARTARAVAGGSFREQKRGTPGGLA